MKFEKLPKGVRLAVEAAQEKKAGAITVLDLSGLSAFTEYFVICTGYSTPQLQAICSEVEEVLSRFPGVAEAAVFGVPDAEKGELIKAMVVPRGALDVAALQAYCREHLGKHKQPRRIEVVSELPKNFLGKVLRRKLRETNGSIEGDQPTVVNTEVNIIAQEPV